eukprot:CAMPEP_0196791596 /NCGR_PEP_ID=MMETSP1104-20130614/30092_1 /TAXON_ID=33652 /ORGANISM="Cafeteria sp., Strain Caron Lab Isolate" /LENGTH=54 /DNA_ID=CAMNT_0042161961 /DNA_START=278 /DNA_END=439 /DNA_ORIENTATION=-
MTRNENAAASNVSTANAILSSNSVVVDEESTSSTMAMAAMATLATTKIAPCLQY